MMTFPTEWKVIKFHGSKPPIRNHKASISLHGKPWHLKALPQHRGHRRQAVGANVDESSCLGPVFTKMEGKKTWEKLRKSRVIGPMLETIGNL
jgi:hypothetical protein